ncbi:MAG TPA: glycosyltransferase family 2 protein [Candidatus Binatia bacterium]|nr:glycosyltransferase family 2 protein [Candidatus Binatia bacterium]
MFPVFAVTAHPVDEARKVRSGRRLSVVLPMWNEGPNIARTVEAAREACSALVPDGEFREFELVIVNDASTDGTGEVADRMAEADPRIRVVHHDRNRRLGASIRSGLREATGDLVLYTDADLPVDPWELSRASRIMRIYEAGIVSAYRLDRTSEGMRRMLYSLAYNWLIRLAFGLRVRDVNFAFKLIDRAVLDQIELVSRGSFIDAELLIRAQRLGFEIVQIGVDYFPRQRGTSTLSSMSVIRDMLVEMMRLYRELRSIKPVSGR